MASGRIKGITIEIGGDTTNLQKSLKAVDSQLKTTQANLKDIDKLLKLNPSSVELLTQKQKNLEKSIELTKQRLNELKDAQAGVEKGTAEWDALQREIIETETNLKSLQKEYKAFGSVASQQMKAVGSSLKSAGSKVEEFGKKLAPVSGAAAAIGAGLLKLGYDAAVSADDLNTLSKQTGISTDELQKMQYAADLVDVSVEDITGALKKLKGKIDPNNESLQKLGVSATNADGSLRNATDVFYDAISALSGISNETERDQMAMELFGKSADSLAGIIDDGGESLRLYGQQAEDLGLILDGETLTALNDTNDKIDQMKAQIAGTMALIGAEVVPVMEPLLTTLQEGVKKLTDKVKKLTPEQAQNIAKVIALVAAIGPLIIVGGKLISGIGTIITVLGTLIGVLGGPLTIAIGAVIAIGVLLYKNWDTVKEKASELKTRIENSWNNIKTAVSNAVDAAKGKIDDLKSRFDTLRDKVSDVWNFIRNIFSGGISVPHIPLPHFSIYPPGWSWGDLFDGIIPSLDISWYRKAYDNPVMFSSPTVMATPGGMKGFGDGHGAEIVMGLDKLRQLVGSSEGITVNVYASPGMDVNRLADAVQDRLVQLQRQREAAYA